MFEKKNSTQTCAKIQQQATVVFGTVRPARLNNSKNKKKTGT